MYSLIDQVGDRMEFLLEDLLTCAYMLKRALGLRNEQVIGKTMYFKTISNIILDGRTNSFIQWEPHPFGAVPIISAMNGFRFRYDTYLHSPETLEYSLWNFQKAGRQGYFSMTDEQINRIEKKIQSPHRKHILDGYSEIYSQLSTGELNQMATCRDEKKAFLCTDYEENLWIMRMENLFRIFDKEFTESGNPLGSQNFDDIINKVKKLIVDAAVTASQITVKIEMFKRNGELVTLLKKRFPQSINALAQDLIDNIQVIPISDRLSRLEKRGVMARDLTSLVRLVCSAFRIEDDVELSRFEPIGQLKLFSDYSTVIHNRAIEIGKKLNIRNRKELATRIIEHLNHGMFKSCMSLIKEEILSRYVSMAKADPSKPDGFMRSEFTVLDNLSLLEFEISSE
jgi:hypothetical protein